MDRVRRRSRHQGRDILRARCGHEEGRLGPSGAAQQHVRPCPGGRLTPHPGQGVIEALQRKVAQTPGESGLIDVGQCQGGDALGGQCTGGYQRLTTRGAAEDHHQRAVRWNVGRHEQRADESRRRHGQVPGGFAWSRGGPDRGPVGHDGAALDHLHLDGEVASDGELRPALGGRGRWQGPHQTTRISDVVAARHRDGGRQVDGSRGRPGEGGRGYPRETPRVMGGGRHRDPCRRIDTADRDERRLGQCLDPPAGRSDERRWTEWLDGRNCRGRAPTRPRTPSG